MGQETVEDDLDPVDLGDVYLEQKTVLARDAMALARLHTEILEQETFADLHAQFPERFNNKTNGITSRRFLLQCNPGLADLITEAIGEGWAKRLYRLSELRRFANDSAFQERWALVKRRNKEMLASWAHAAHGFELDPLASGAVRGRTRRFQARPKRRGTSRFPSSFCTWAEMRRPDASWESATPSLRADGRDLRDASDLPSTHAVVLARGGDEGGALEQIEIALRKDDGGGHFHHAAYNLAVAYALLGKRQEAVAMLDRVAREGMPCYPLFVGDPFLAALQGYPAFDELLGRMKTQNEHFRRTL